MLSSSGTTCVSGGTDDSFSALGLRSSLWVDGGHVGAVIGSKFFGGAGRPQFVRVTYATYVWAPPWFVPSNRTHVQGQVFEHHPRYAQPDIWQHSLCTSCHSHFVSAVLSLLAPLKLVEHFLGQGCDVAGSFSPFLPWSLPLQRFAVNLRLTCFAFSILRG